MYIFQEPVNYGEDRCVNLRRWKARDKVQGDVRPGTLRGRQEIQESIRKHVEGFSPCADRAGGDELLGVGDQGRPPKPLTKKVKSVGNPRVTRQLRGVYPLQDLGLSGLRDKQVLVGAPPGSTEGGRASRTQSSTCKTVDPMKHASKTIGSGSWQTGCAKNWGNSASGLPFLDPNFYVRVNVNWPRNRAQLACWELKGLGPRR